MKIRLCQMAWLSEGHAGILADRLGVVNMLVTARRTSGRQIKRGARGYPRPWDAVDAPAEKHGTFVLLSILQEASACPMAR